MRLTRSFKETVQARVQRDPAFREALLAEAVDAFPTGEAVAASVDREPATIEGVKRGLADMKADRLVPHDEAMAEIYAAIGAANLS